jgi:DNA invertase Pin-like site-specific DNA recombinase
VTLHFLLRRSKAEGSQEHSLDTQRAGCAAFAATLKHAGAAPLEHVSDGVAGDDVEALVALRRLVDQVKPGDVVVCRDHSRLGRDMLESATTIRTLVQDRAAELYYYSSGERIHWRNAADGVMSVLRGFAAQTELEHIRSRTTEALRARAAAGHVAGGACYGYRNERQRDATGREHTVAVVYAPEAEIVLRIFASYLEGAGIGAIAKLLNEEHVPPPSAGTKRGTRSWSPSAVREILRRERYVGVYSHGKVKRKRENGKRVVVERNRAGAVRTEIPEWRIVDDMTWKRVQDKIAQRGKAHVGVARAPGGRHPLTGIARCAGCGGGLTLGHTKVSGGRRVRAYVCSYHWKRGKAVCPVSVAQPQDEVEELLAAHLVSATLAPAVMAEVARQIRLEAEGPPPSAGRPRDLRPNWRS